MAEMTAAARKKYNEYQRKWRKEHPEKVKANRERYWEKKAAESAAGNDAETVEK